MTAVNTHIRVAVVGAGAWGTALACVMARRGHKTLLWGRDKVAADSISNSGRNEQYLPEIDLPQQLVATSHLEEAVSGAELVLVVTPAQTIGSVVSALAPGLEDKTPVVLCAKGIDRETGMLPSQTARTILPHQTIAALSGPSFAHDVARNLPTAVTLAADKMDEATSIAALVSGEAFRVYGSDDLLGVELGGALKNVIALAVGVSRGMGLGASAEAALIARGFAELTRLATAMGAKPSTLMGLSGLGDLVLTCSSPQSRNFAYGMALGKGDNTRGMKLAEGALTASIAGRLAGRHDIDTPIIDMVNKLLEHAITPAEAMRALLSRPLKSESE